MTRKVFVVRRDVWGEATEDVEGIFASYQAAKEWIRLHGTDDCGIEEWTVEADGQRQMPLPEREWPSKKQRAYRLLGPRALSPSRWYGFADLMRVARGQRQPARAAESSQPRSASNAGRP